MVAGRQRRRRAGRAVVVAPGQHDAGAEAGQRVAGGEADAAGAAEDDGDLAGKRREAHGVVRDDRVDGKGWQACSGRSVDRRLGKVGVPGSSAKSKSSVS